MDSINSIFIITSCLILGYSVDAQAQNKTEVDLINALVGEGSAYNKHALPAYNATTPVGVRVDLTLNFIQELNEEDQTLTISTYFRLSWTDTKLLWNSSEYGGIKAIRMPPENIWTPDVTAYNGISFSLYGHSDGHIPIKAIVYSNGNVMWVPAATIKVPCPLDFTDFPYDTQKCAIKLGSWTYDSSRLDLTTISEPIETENFETRGKFKFVKNEVKRNSHKYACCPENFVDIDFILYLKRQSGYTLHLVIVPTVIICLILPALFLFPTAGAVEKVVFGVGLMITESVQLLVLMNMLPNSHPSMPRLGIFHIVMLILIALSLALTAFISMIWRKGVRGDAMPAFMDKIVLILGKFVFISRQNPATTIGTYNQLDSLSTEAATTDDQAAIIPTGQMDKEVAGSEWRQLAAILDRVCFWVYVLVCVIGSFVFNFA